MRESMREVYRGSTSRPMRLLRLMVAIVGAGPLLSACAMSVPVPGLSLDDNPTGTIKKSVISPFSAEMDGEDWRRAKSALDTALDPQGNGAKVTWDNPQSGAKGTFVPTASPYPKDDGICRAFTAAIEVQGRAHQMRSSACRRNGGEWIVGRIVPLDNKKAPGSPQVDKLAERDTSTHLN